MSRGEGDLMAKSILGALFASDDDDEKNRGGEAQPPDETGEFVEPGSRPRSLADSFNRLAEQNRRIEVRLETIEAVERQLLEVANGLADSAKQQLQVLHYIGKFQES